MIQYFVFSIFSFLIISHQIYAADTHEETSAPEVSDTSEPSRTELLSSEELMKEVIVGRSCEGLAAGINAWQLPHEIDLYAFLVIGAGEKTVFAVRKMDDRGDIDYSSNSQGEIKRLALTFGLVEIEIKDDMDMGPYFEGTREQFSALLKAHRQFMLEYNQSMYRNAKAWTEKFGTEVSVELAVRCGWLEIYFNEATPETRVRARLKTDAEQFHALKAALLADKNFKIIGYKYNPNGKKDDLSLYDGIDIKATPRHIIELLKSHPDVRLNPHYWNQLFSDNTQENLSAVQIFAGTPDVEVPAYARAYMAAVKDLFGLEYDFATVLSATQKDKLQLLFSELRFLETIHGKDSQQVLDFIKAQSEPLFIDYVRKARLLQSLYLELEKKLSE